MTPAQTRDALVTEMREYADTSDGCQYGTISTRLLRDFADRLAALPVGAAEPVTLDMVIQKNLPSIRCFHPDGRQVEFVRRDLMPPAAVPAGFVPLDVDNARLALWKAIGNIQFGNKTDDKLILDELRKLGVWLITAAPKVTR